VQRQHSVILIRNIVLSSVSESGAPWPAPGSEGMNNLLGAACNSLQSTDRIDFPQTISAEFIAKDTGSSAAKSRGGWVARLLFLPGPRSIHLNAHLSPCPD
jgi:hypothetical protein